MVRVERSFQGHHQHATEDQSDRPRSLIGLTCSPEALLPCPDKYTCGGTVSLAHRQRYSIHPVHPKRKQ